MSFSVKGCLIKVDFYFVLILAFLCLVNVKDLLNLLLFSALHELGHLFALLLSGCKPSVLSFSYYGFAMKYNDCLSKSKEALVIITGPLVNLVLYLLLNDDINLILFVLNSLPVYPLDGGRLVKLLFHKAFKIVSITALLCVFSLSVYLALFERSFSLLLISLYLTVYTLNY